MFNRCIFNFNIGLMICKAQGNNIAVLFHCSMVVSFSLYFFVYHLSIFPFMSLQALFLLVILGCVVLWLETYKGDNMIRFPSTLGFWWTCCTRTFCNIINEKLLILGMDTCAFHDAYNGYWHSDCVCMFSFTWVIFWWTNSWLISHMFSSI